MRWVDSYRQCTDYYLTARPLEPACPPSDPEGNEFKQLGFKRDMHKLNIFLPSHWD